MEYGWSTPDKIEVDRKKHNLISARLTKIKLNLRQNLVYNLQMGHSVCNCTLGSWCYK